MNRNLYAFALILFFSTSSFAQSPGYLWAKSAYGTLNDDVVSITYDANDNVLVAGTSNSSSLVVGSNTLTHTGNGNIFIIKYDPSGNILWARSSGQTGGDAAKGIAVDASGNVFVAGYFYGPNIIFGTYTLTNSGTNSNEMFIVKYDPSGNVLWAKRAGGSSQEYAYSVAVDGSGNAFVIGTFSSGSVAFGTFTLTNADGGDIFLVKYDPSGNVLWAKKTDGDNYTAYGNAVSTDASGNAIITGYYIGTGLTVGTNSLVNAGASGSSDIFVAKYDPSGNVLWAKTNGGTANEFANGISVDASGNSIVTGEFLSSSFVLGTNTLVTQGYNDVFVAKYDPSGNVLWANSHGSTYFESGKAVSTDPSGNIVIIGTLASASITVGSYTLNNSGSYDVFVIKYNSGGAVTWAKSLGGGGMESGNAIDINSTGNVVVGGGFGSVNLTLGTTTLTCNGGSDAYVTKLDNNVGIYEINSAANSIVVYPNPNKGVFYIQTETVISTIEIINMLGEQIYDSKDFSIIKNKIDISDKPKGVYFLRVTSGGETATGKIILE